MTIVKKRSVLAAVMLLVALNVWRWWPSTQVPPEKAGGAAAVFHLEDFEMESSFSSRSEDPLSRDIFHPKIIVVPKPVMKAAPKDSPPVKSPEELAYEAAQAEFSQIRCVGVSVRDNRFQAYLFSQGAHFLVSAGDKVGSRFVVEKITSDGVRLRDPDTEIGGEVSVSGK
jgi:hypothetical protein